MTVELWTGQGQKESRVVMVELWTGTERVEGCDGRVMDMDRKSRGL